MKDENFLRYFLIDRMEKKAAQSNSTFFIAAAAFTKRGNFLGFETNGRNNKMPASRRGAGKHAEASLIRKYGRRIDTIYILRVGHNGKRLPIDPCENCSKIAANMGIKIVPLHYEYGCTCC